MNRLNRLLGLCLSATFLAACGISTNGLTPSLRDGVGAPPSARSQALVGKIPFAQENELYTFQGATDGANPYAGLLAKNGEFYGTTFAGGAGPSGGYGTAFRLSPTGTESILYAFQGAPDGASPEAGLTAGKKGVLYGATTYGGSTCTGGCGTVFDLVPKGTGYREHVLYRFQYGNDGANPIGSILTNKSGALYGTTAHGGGSAACTSGCGIVFRLTRSSSGYTETALYRFQGGTDGGVPDGTLIADNHGALFGTTSGGGSANSCSGGCGTVFKLTPSGSVYTESILYSFLGGSSDGANPRSALLAGKNGAFYGTTIRGGPKGLGTVFEIMPAGSLYSERVLYFFKGGKDGAFPKNESGLYADTSGALYGTTFGGGGGPSGGNGTVFKLAPSGSTFIETILHRFQGGSDGISPAGGLIADATGLLYGTTFWGGSGPCSGSVPGCGVVFKVSP